VQLETKGLRKRELKITLTKPSLNLMLLDTVHRPGSVTPTNWQLRRF